MNSGDAIPIPARFALWVWVSRPPSTSGPDKIGHGAAWARFARFCGDAACKRSRPPGYHSHRDSTWNSSDPTILFGMFFSARQAPRAPFAAATADTPVVAAPAPMPAANA